MFFIFKVTNYRYFNKKQKNPKKKLWYFMAIFNNYKMGKIRRTDAGQYTTRVLFQMPGTTSTCKMLSFKKCY